MEIQWNNNNNNNNHDLQLSLRPPVQNTSTPVLLPPPPRPRRRSVVRSHIERANSIASLRTSRSSFGNNPRSSPATGRCNSRPAAAAPVRGASTGAIRPPYPWSTEQRAVVQSLKELKSKGIVRVAGEVRCRRCQRQYEIEYEVESKFEEIAKFVEENKDSFHDRAPSEWMYPKFPRCKFCDLENGARPVIPEERRRINWLFLLLGQMLGFLNLNHLKYFCTFTHNHRTGAKNRLLYLTYITLCHQLDPSGRFDR